MTHVSAGDAPFVVVHGTDDCTVPTPQGQRMHDALVAGGVESTYFEVAGAGHNSKQVSTAEVTTAVAEFLDSTLRGCQTVEPPEPPQSNNPPPTPDYETVDACQQGECAVEYAACEALAGCTAVEACFRDCLAAMQGGCVNQCASNLSPAVFQAHKTLFMCANAQGCYALL